MRRGNPTPVTKRHRHPACIWWQPVSDGPGSVSTPLLLGCMNPSNCERVISSDPGLVAVWWASWTVITHTYEKIHTTWNISTYSTPGVNGAQDKVKTFCATQMFVFLCVQSLCAVTGLSNTYCDPIVRCNPVTRTIPGIQTHRWRQRSPVLSLLKAVTHIPAGARDLWACSSKLLPR